MAQVDEIVTRTSDDERCRGCGSGEGSDYSTCDLCGAEICVDCEPYRDDDAPIDLCEECCG